MRGTDDAAARRGLGGIAPDPRRDMPSSPSSTGAPAPEDAALRIGDDADGKEEESGDAAVFSL